MKLRAVYEPEGQPEGLFAMLPLRWPASIGPVTPAPSLVGALVMFALSAAVHPVEAATNLIASYEPAPGGLQGTQPYNGGVYSPMQNRIYLVPYDQGDQMTWHYIDCVSNQAIGFQHILTSAVTRAYAGGVYSPTQNRIYFVPFRQGPEGSWHYVDCDTGTIVAYVHGKIVATDAYSGGVYSEIENRIYLVPYDQASTSPWHYIDCNNGAVVGYGETSLAISNAYAGGVYSPTLNRVYFVPFNAASLSEWHYVDCNNDTVVSYQHPAVTGPLYAQAYKGGVYSPTLDRIYFIPRGQAANNLWHYISSAGAVVEYDSGDGDCVAGPDAYDGGVLDPVLNRIYFVPSGQSGCESWQACNDTRPQWHYIDCASGAVMTYAVDESSVDCDVTSWASPAYSGGVSITEQDKIYFMPSGQAFMSQWHYVNVGTAQPTSSPTASPTASPVTPEPSTPPTTTEPSTPPTTSPTSSPTTAPTIVLGLNAANEGCTSRLTELKRLAADPAESSYVPGGATAVPSMFDKDLCPNRTTMFAGGAVDRDDAITFELVIDGATLGTHYETCLVDSTGRFTVTLDASMPIGQHAATINARVTSSGGTAVSIPVANWTMDVRVLGAFGLTAAGTTQQQQLEQHVADNIVKLRVDVGDSVTFPGFNLSSTTLDDLFANYTRGADGEAGITLTVHSSFATDAPEPVRTEGVSLGNDLFVISTSGKMLLKADVPGKHRIELRAAARGSAQAFTVLDWIMHVRSGPNGKPCSVGQGVPTDDVDDVSNHTYLCTCSGDFSGDNCETVPTEAVADSGSSADSAAVIGAVSVAGVLLAAVLVGGVLLWRRQRKLNAPFDFSQAVALLQLDGKTGVAINGDGGEDDGGEDNGTARVVPEELPRSSIVLITELGHGQFGTVHKGLYKPPRTVPGHGTALAVNNMIYTGKGSAPAKPTFEYTVAVKSLKEAPTPDTKADFMREAAITAQFDHPNVVGLIGVVTKADPCLLVLQFCENGALDVMVGERDLAPDLLCTFSQHIALGMAYLSSRRFVHRDLASRNVLVDTRDRAKIADFGMSREFEDSAYYTASDTNARMPLRWMAPEVFTSHKFGEASDVWSFGVTLIEIFSHADTPYKGWTNLFVCERVKGGYILPCPPTCPAALYAEVVAPCFSMDPRDRPSFQALSAVLESLSKPRVSPSPPPDTPGAPVTRRREGSLKNQSYAKLARSSSVRSQSGGYSTPSDALPPTAKLENHGVVYASGGEIDTAPAVDAIYAQADKGGRGAAAAGESGEWVPEPIYPYDAPVRRSTLWEQPPDGAAGRAIELNAQGDLRLTPAYSVSPKFSTRIASGQYESPVAGVTPGRSVAGPAPYGRLGPELVPTDAAYAVLETTAENAPTAYAPLNQKQTSAPRENGADSGYARLGDAHRATSAPSGNPPGPGFDDGLGTPAATDPSHRYVEPTGIADARYAVATSNEVAASDVNPAVTYALATPNQVGQSHGEYEYASPAMPHTAKTPDYDQILDVEAKAGEPVHSGSQPVEPRYALPVATVNGTDDDGSNSDGDI